MTGTPLVGNRAIEDAAIDWVMELERRSGRTPIDRRSDAAFAGDIWSDPFTIEVKAAGARARGGGLWLETAQVNAAEVDPAFVLDLVENVAQGDPRKFAHRRFEGEHLRRLLANKKAQTYYVVPLPASEYDAAVSHASLAAGPIDMPDRRPSWAVAISPGRVSTTQVPTAHGPRSVATLRAEYVRVPGPKPSWQETYGKTPIVGHDGQPSCAEVEIVGSLRRAGWHAHWIDTFGQAPAKWRGSIVVPAALPEPLRSMFQAIDSAAVRAGGKKGGRWDIVAWLDETTVFIESKGAGDSLRPSQIAWFEAAMATGVDPDGFGIVNYVVRA